MAYQNTPDSALFETAISILAEINGSFLKPNKTEIQLREENDYATIEMRRRCRQLQREIYARLYPEGDADLMEYIKLKNTNQLKTK